MGPPLPGKRPRHKTATGTTPPPSPAAMPSRILNNVAYFVGRSLAGEDSIEPLTGRAAIYAGRVRWIEARRQWMVEQLTAKLAQA